MKTRQAFLILFLLMGLLLWPLPPAHAAASLGLYGTFHTMGVIVTIASTVALVAASPSPSLTLGLAPAAVDPPGQAMLTLTDTHPGPALLPGLWYTMPITATGGGSTQTTSVGLLVGGARIYLPLILK